VDSQILGTAGNDSTAIAGLFTSSKKTAFAATWDGLVPAASTVDLIEKMKLQCENNKYRPDAVVINPTDLSAIGADKDQLDNSKNDRRVVYSAIGEPTFVCGLRVIKSTALTADTLAVLDSKQVLIGKRKDMTMEIGYDSDDFKVGKKTVNIKVRVAFGVRDAKAVIYSSGIAAAVASLLKS
jgi:HK97 family phage major capsid protein